MRLGNSLFQNVLDKSIQGFPLIHGITHKALVKLGIKAKIEGALEGWRPPLFKISSTCSIWYRFNVGAGCGRHFIPCEVSRMRKKSLYQLVMFAHECPVE